MAYLIEIRDGHLPRRVLAALQGEIAESKFIARDMTLYADTIDMGKIRLKEAKLYCGQHPGECLVGPRRKGRWLEWDDWVEFHELVNDVLDKLKVAADVTTRPMETVDRVRGLKGRFWIRKGLRRRVHYDWRTDYSYPGREVRWWNPGTEDQFV